MANRYSDENILGISQRVNRRIGDVIGNVFKALLITVLLAMTTARAATAERLPGEYAIRTILKNTYLTARPGNHTIDTLITSATAPGFHEKFHLERMQPNFTLIKSWSNYFVSTAGGGGRGGDYDATTVLQTERQVPADDALFRLQSYKPGDWAYTIQTYRGYYLTALGGGGKPTSAFHTDATKASTWEGYRISQCGDPGSGYQYAIFPKGSARPITTIGTGKVSVSDADAIFKLIRQPGTRGYELWYTKRSGNAGVVAFWEQGRCTYTMQAATGLVGVNQAGKISNTIPNPQTGANQGYNVYFELRPFI